MQQTCVNCGGGFEMTQDDLVLLDKVSPVINERKYSLPPPTLCPSCRCQRRLAQRNENKLYRRTCALTGKPMISLYSEDKPYTVYAESAWGSDAWDPMEYGCSFDFSRTFFEQFDELMHAVPRRGMHQDGTAENSDYTAFGINNKNCYLAFSCFLCEDVYCSSWTGMSKNCMDCLLCIGGELLYECVDCTKCYRCFFCHDSSNCQDSMLLEDCRNCRHCIGCKNLREKEYQMYNKPVSKEEFEATWKRLMNRAALQQERDVFDQWRMTLPTQATHMTQSERCTGNYIEQSKNCIDCFDLHLGTEDCRHCQICGWNAKDMMDCSSAGKNAEILYEMHAAANATQHCAFVSFVRSCEHVYYSENMALCKHCFGCIGLNRKQFCILNRQHTEQEYFELVETIITHMQRMKEWGEFFPITVSPFCYNETLAHEHFPLSKEEALAKGWKWKDVTGDSPKLERTISAKELPTTITEVKDDILDVAILCEATHKPFRIVKQELDFYRRMELPLPQFHPEERHRRRMIQRTPYRLWSRTCQKCQKEIQTSYAPDRPEFVVCEECYLKEIY